MTEFSFSLGELHAYASMCPDRVHWGMQQQKQVYTIYHDMPTPIRARYFPHLKYDY